MKNEQLTGRIQTCILIDGTVRNVPVAKIVVDPLYFKASTETLCMTKPIYDLILCNIPGVKEPSIPDFNWDTWHLEKERSCLDNIEVSWRQESAIYRILGECLLISSLSGKALRTLVDIARLAEGFNMRSQSRAW